MADVTDHTDDRMFSVVGTILTIIVFAAAVGSVATGGFILGKHRLRQEAKDANAGHYIFDADDRPQWKWGPKP